PASCPSHRPVQNSRSLDDGDSEKQHDENAERERNGDRTMAAAAFLRLGEDDSLLLALVIHCVPICPLPGSKSGPKSGPKSDRRRNGAHDDLEEERRKQREQIKDGESEQLTRGAERLAALAADIDVDRKHEHAGAEDQ